MYVVAQATVRRHPARSCASSFVKTSIETLQFIGGVVFIVELASHSARMADAHRVPGESETTTLRAPITTMGPMHTPGAM